jgi:two-component system response regulator RegA
LGLEKIPAMTNRMDKSLSDGRLRNGRHMTVVNSIDSPNSTTATVCKAPLADLSTILVVDVDLRNLYELSYTLREAGYRVLQAASFHAAKRLALTEKIRCLIADVRLGEFNGLQLLLRAREREPGLLGIITSAFPDNVLEAEARRFGGVFMLKPVDGRQLLDAISKHAADRLARPHHPDGSAALAGTNADGKSGQPSANRRRTDRRELVIPDFVPERRTADRRAPARGERRMADRRQLVMPSYFPERRIAERRRASRP